MLAVSATWEGFVWVVGASLLVGLAGHYLLHRVLLAISGRTGNLVGNSLVRRCYRPVNWFIVVVVLRLICNVPVFKEMLPEPVYHAIGLLLIGLVCWLLVNAVYVLEDFVVTRFKMDVKDNLQARKIHTQFRVLKRIVTVGVVVMGFATMLMTFERIRQLGTTILASAGVIGIVVGMAAQRTIGAFIAGLQIAVTQPIRVDDVVIVESEWGRIEEITLTYVVVRIWDLRRLIVPITYFIEKPFQNWTRVSADILGTVFLYVDYSVPIAALRAELGNIVKSSKLWDGKVCVLQVTNTTERAMELRALVSAADASAAWELRCQVRERLVQFVQQNYPQALPKVRAELHKIDAGTC